MQVKSSQQQRSPSLSTATIAVALNSNNRRRSQQRPSPGGMATRSPSAPGDGRQDRHLVAVLDGRVEAVEKADVLAADVHVDEPPEPAVLGDPAAQVAVAL